jgi:hypothetical protein
MRRRRQRAIWATAQLKVMMAALRRYTPEGPDPQPEAAMKRAEISGL